MMPLRTALMISGALAIASLPASAQVTRYGAPTPSGFGVELTNGPFQSFAGNTRFQLRLTGPNPYGGGLFVALSRASIPLGAWTLLLDPLTLQTAAFPFSPGVVSKALPLPVNPAIYGLPVDFQALVLTNGGIDIGATNAVEVRVQRYRTPTRGYFTGEDYSQGNATPAQFATMDLSAWPPDFRATGDVGYAGMTGENHPVAVAVSDRLDYAFLHGNRSTNPFIRVFDISADPQGVVAYSSLGDIQLAQGPYTGINYSDLELSRDGRWLFCTTGMNQVSIELLVFDLSGLPNSLPTAPVQVFSLPTSSVSAAILDISPDDRLLALSLTEATSGDVFLYDITSGARPLVPRAILLVPNSNRFGSPSAIDISPDSRRLFVVTHETFSYYDVSSTPPVALVANATWWPGGGSVTAFHPALGGTLAVQNGRTVAVAAEGVYHLIDLAEPPSSTFGTVVRSFHTDPSANLPPTNISNARLHSLGNIVVAIEGFHVVSGNLVDVIDLNVPDLITGYRAARVHAPSSGRLTGSMSVPVAFELR